MASNKPMNIHVFDDRVVVERTQDGSCLLIQRSLPEGPQLEAHVDEKGRMLKELKGGQTIPFDAIFGIYHLLSGPFMALILDSEVVVSFMNIEFRKVSARSDSRDWSLSPQVGQ
jgi:hypothetical protein